MTKNPFRYFKTSREVIQLAVMMYVRFPLSLKNVEDLLHERGIEVSTKASGFGSTDLAPSSQSRYGLSAQRTCAGIPNGSGTSTRSL